MGVLKDGSLQCGEMGLAVVAVQILSTVPPVAVDIVGAATERAHILTVVLNLDNEINRRLLRGESFLELEYCHIDKSLSLIYRYIL